MTTSTDNSLARYSNRELIDELESRRVGGTGREHVLDLSASSWAIDHPLNCRLVQSVRDCPLTAAMESDGAWDYMIERGEGRYSIYPEGMNEAVAEIRNGGSAIRGELAGDAEKT